MKRISCLSLLLAALVCIEGCKRGASEKKPPMQVLVEKDFIASKSSSGLINKLKPERQGDAEPVNEAAERLKRKDVIEKIGQAVVAFLNESTPKDRSLDKFKSYLRRKGLSDLRDEVDGNDVEVVLFALPNAPKHIVVYSKDNASGDSDVYEVGPPNLPKHSAVLVKGPDLAERIKQQELSTVYRQVWEFSMPYYVNMPSDQPGAMALKNRLNVGLPRDALAAVRAQSPQLMKNPPERRDMERFAKYLNENASPDIRASTEGKLRVNLSADFNAPDDLVVCLGNGEQQKGHMAITASGAFNYYASEVISQRFQQK